MGGEVKEKGAWVPLTPAKSVPERHRINWVGRGWNQDVGSVENPQFSPICGKLGLAVEKSCNYGCEFGNSGNDCLGRAQKVAQDREAGLSNNAVLGGVENAENGGGSVAGKAGFMISRDEGSRFKSSGLPGKPEDKIDRISDKRAPRETTGFEVASAEKEGSQVRVHDLHCEFGSGSTNASSLQKNQTPKKRSYEGTDLNKKPRKRMTMKRHRPKVFDESKPLKPSTPKPRTPRRAKYVKKKDSLETPVDPLKDVNCKSYKNYTRRKLDYSMENCFVTQNLKACDELKLQTDSGSKFRRLQVYQRIFRPNECLKNSRKLGPNFPYCYKKKRIRRQRAAVIDKFIKLVSMISRAQRQRRARAARNERMNLYSAGKDTKRISRKLSQREKSLIACVSTKRMTTKAIKDQTTDKCTLTWMVNCKRKRSKTSTRSRDLLSFINDLAKIQVSEAFLLKASSIRNQDTEGDNFAGHDEGVQHFSTERSIEQNELPQNSVFSCHGSTQKSPRELGDCMLEAEPDLIEHTTETDVVNDQVIDSESLVKNKMMEMKSYFDKHGKVEFPTCFREQDNMLKSKHSLESYHVRPCIEGPRDEQNKVFPSQDYDAFSKALVDFAIQRMESLHIDDRCNQLMVQDQTAHSDLVPSKGKFDPSKRRKQLPKVDLDPETLRVWNLLMENKETEDTEQDNDKAKYWKKQREIFHGRMDSFIARMLLIQGDRRFSPWKGSVVDSVVGVFLTQNVSDHLSSTAFMSLAARFPPSSLSWNNSCDNISHSPIHETQQVETVESTSAKSEELLIVEKYSTASNQVEVNNSCDDRSDSATHEIQRGKIVELASGKSEELLTMEKHSTASNNVEFKNNCNDRSDSAIHEIQQAKIVGSASGTSEELLIMEKYSTAGNQVEVNNHCDDRSDSAIREIPQRKIVESASGKTAELLIMEKLSSSSNKVEVNNGCDERSYSAIHEIQQGKMVKSALGKSEELLTMEKHSTACNKVEVKNSCNSRSDSAIHESQQAKIAVESASRKSEELLITENHSSSTKKVEVNNSCDDRSYLAIHEIQLAKIVESASGKSEELLITEKYSTASNQAEVNNCCDDRSDSVIHEIQRRKVIESASGKTEKLLIMEKPSTSSNKVDVNNSCDDRSDSAIHEVQQAKLVESDSGKTEALLIREKYSTASNQVEVNPENGSKTSFQTESSSRRKKGKAKEKQENKINWDDLRKKHFNGRSRNRMDHHVDSVNWEAVRQVTVEELAEVIMERGMNNILAHRIKDFLDRIVRDHGSIDLEWLRDVPRDKAKEYLLSIPGLGLKSVECVMLLTLHHQAFPVDTNVGRILVRLGWVPLQPLPEDVQIHLLNQYPLLDSIQKYIWPRVCDLEALTLYEGHYQMITFGKLFCTKRQPNCNACPMNGECRHYASAVASARLCLEDSQERNGAAESSVASGQGSMVHRSPQLLSNCDGDFSEGRHNSRNCEPIVEIPESPEPVCTETLERDVSASLESVCTESLERDILASARPVYTVTLERDIEDSSFESSDEEIPTIKLNTEEFKKNVLSFVGGEDDSSKALIICPEHASVPMPKLKYASRLRTVHHVYELPDSHLLLEGFKKREPDDPCPYLLAIWMTDESANSSQNSTKVCNCQESKCELFACCSSENVQYQNDQMVRGTILIPCRTANRGSFPLNGTYFQVNEVFADHESSRHPIAVPRKWIWNLRRRSLYCGTSATSISRGMSLGEIVYCFRKGFICVRGFERVTRAPKPLARRFHVCKTRQIHDD